jgi:hypothetical protein
MGDSDGQKRTGADADAVDQKGYAGQVARKDFQEAMYMVICKSFIRIQKNLVVTFAAKLTPEALSELEAIEVAAGVRQALAPIAPPPPPKSPAELLTEEIRRDWVHLRTAEVKRKLNNKAYKAEFDRLMNTGELKSQVTSYTDGSAEFRR